MKRKTKKKLNYKNGNVNNRGGGEGIAIKKKILFLKLFFIKKCH